MRDVPGIAWILIAALILGSVVGVYSITAPRPLPQVEAVWNGVETIRQSLQFRRESVAARGSKQLSYPPYTITLSRISDTVGEDSVARYLLRVEATGFIPTAQPWISGGLSVALVDFRPREPIGQVKIVALSKQASTKVQ